MSSNPYFLTRSVRMSFSTNNRSTIDSEVYKWVVQQLKKKKVVTPNAIRQKAFEIGQEFDPNFKASINWYNNWKKRFDYNESPEAEALKHKKRSYTAAFKLHAVQRAMELESASQASLELDVSRRCLQRWRDELDVISSVAEHSSNAVYRRPGQGRKVRDTSLDTRLLEWVKDCWKQSISLSSGMIREKARELSLQPDFKASLGWFVKWQKRHCVDLKEQTCSPCALEVATPLKLRLLPEGEMSAYSTPKKRRLSKKRALSYDDTALLENDEEFDRLLLTWLVERWEAGDIVNDKMLKERAMELTANPDFKASKVWLQAWKGKYNVSLENQTYGTDGDEENEEIIEETQVYDEQVVIEGEQQPTTSSQEEGGADETPVTPTKEEAATALASLSADDHEIAEALQKLANAFGLAQSASGSGAGAGAGAGGDTGSKEAVSQLAALQQSDSAEFLLEGAGRVAVEEVVSEEVVTDEPMVVIEGTGVSEASGSASALSTMRSEDISSTTVQSIVDVVSAATQIAQSITGSSNPSVTQPVAESLIQAVANQLSHSSSTQQPSGGGDRAQEASNSSGEKVGVPQPAAESLIQAVASQLEQSDSTPATQAQEPSGNGREGSSVTEPPPTAPEEPVAASTPSTSLSVTAPDETTATAAPVQYLTEEVIISEPIVETSITTGDHSEPIFEAEGVIGGQMEVVVQGGEEGAIVSSTQLDGSDSIVNLAAAEKSGELQISPLPPAHMISTTAAEVQVLTTGGNEIVMATGGEILDSGTHETEVTVEGGEISIPEGSGDILDIVQERMVGGGANEAIGGVVSEGGGDRDYEEGFKQRVKRRVLEVGSVQQAAREFSIPWKVVASWSSHD